MGCGVSWSFAFCCAGPEPSLRVQITLNGTVLDSAGAAVPEAHITVVNTGANATQTTESNGEGAYLAPDIATGVIAH